MIILALVSVLLSPWKGPSLPTAPTGNYETSFAMNVRGVPHGRVALRADGVAKGWVASFCTPRLCSPFRSVVMLDAKGTARLEFSLIRTDPKAVAHTRALIRSGNQTLATASR